MLRFVPLYLLAGWLLADLVRGTVNDYTGYVLFASIASQAAIILIFWIWDIKKFKKK